MNIDFKAARSHAEQVAQNVGERLREGFGVAGAIAHKSSDAFDAVTMYDIEADDAFFKGLAHFDPTIGYVGEERGQSGQESTFWLVDPIDGTGHFLRGLPFCTSMVALIHQGEVVVSVIHDFVRNNTYSAHKDGGATRDGELIKVSDRALSDAYVEVETNLDVPGNFELFRQIGRVSVPVSLVNCGWSFSMIASGNLDGRIMKNPWGSTWDFAPGALLVSEAGGCVANIGEETYDYRNLDFIAAGPRVFEGLTQGPDAVFPISAD